MRPGPPELGLGARAGAKARTADFHDAPHIGNGRIPLPSARKAVVDGNPVHFGVARAQAARILRCAYKRFDVVLGHQRFEKTRKISNPLPPGARQT